MNIILSEDEANNLKKEDVVKSIYRNLNRMRIPPEGYVVKKFKILVFNTLHPY